MAPAASAVPAARGNVTSPPWGGWLYGGGAGAAENVATLCACVNVIASAIASLPAMVYETMPDGERRESAEHPVAQLIAEPNALAKLVRCGQVFYDLCAVCGECAVGGPAQRKRAAGGVAADHVGPRAADLRARPARPSRRAAGQPGGRLAFDMLRTVAPFGGTGTPRRMFADNGEFFFLRERSNTGIFGASRLLRAPMVLQQAFWVQASPRFCGTMSAPRTSWWPSRQSSAPRPPPASRSRGATPCGPAQCPQGGRWFRGRHGGRPAFSPEMPKTAKY